jgi:ABC-type cobalamin/Fe3+-siderophores transport system ATPase subunit
MSIIINTHSPKEAKVYADNILMIKNGDVYRSGEVEILNDAESLNGLYSLDVDLLEEELSRFVRSIA